MSWQFDILISLLIILCAVTALVVKDLISAIIILAVYSFVMCLLWAEMGAIDVAFTEAAVGAGISTVLMIATILRTKRRAAD